MTREDAISIMNVIVHMLEEKYDTDRVEDAVDMAIKALKQEPCEDTISFPKGTLKKRGKGYVVYNPEWLKENWRTELRVMGIECEDAISRADTIEWLKRVTVTDGITFETGFKQILTDIQNMPSITPKPKMGRWIKSDAVLIVRELKTDTSIELPAEECSMCHKPHIRGYGKQFCPNCGAKMSENPTGLSCTDCVLDGTDACSRGAGRAVDGRVCEDFVGESEEEIGPDKKG